MENAVVEIRVDFVRLRGKSKKTGKAYDFLTARGSDNTGKRCDFKFTKEVDNLPKEEGKYIMVVDKKAINKDRSSVYNQYWIKSVVEFKPYEVVVDDSTLPF